MDVCPWAPLSTSVGGRGLSIPGPCLVESLSPLHQLWPSRESMELALSYKCKFDDVCEHWAVNIGSSTDRSSPISLKNFSKSALFLENLALNSDKSELLENLLVRSDLDLWTWLFFGLLLTTFWSSDFTPELLLWWSPVSELVSVLASLHSLKPGSFGRTLGLDVSCGFSLLPSITSEEMLLCPVWWDRRQECSPNLCCWQCAQVSSMEPLWLLPALPAATRTCGMVTRVPAVPPPLVSPDWADIPSPESLLPTSVRSGGVAVGENSMDVLVRCHGSLLAPTTVCLASDGNLHVQVLPLHSLYSGSNPGWAGNVVSL